MQGIGFSAARPESEGDRIMEYGDKSSFGEDPFRSTSDWMLFRTKSPLFHLPNLVVTLTLAELKQQTSLKHAKCVAQNVD